MTPDELRKLADADNTNMASGYALRQAADEIERLERERGEYRNALHDKIIELALKHAITEAFGPKEDK